MALSLPVLGFVLLLLIAVGVGVGLARRGSRASTVVERTAAEHLTRGRWTAVAAGVVVSVLVGTFWAGGFGREWFIAPGVGAAVALTVIAVTERSVPTEAGRRRTVSLERRRFSVALRPAVAVAAVVCTALLAAVVVLGWMHATTDDTRRYDRAVEWTITGGSQGHAPWPGSFYSVPTLIALAAAAVAFAVALRAVVTRSQVNADAHAELSDNEMRQDSARILVLTFLASLGLSLAVLSLPMFGATSSVESGAPGWVGVAHWLGLVGALVGLVTALASAGAAVARTVRASR